MPEGERVSRFDRYRRGPVTISSPAFIVAVERYLELRGFNLHDLDFSHIPPVRLKNLARHAGIISMHKIARMPVDKRIAILVAFVRTFEVTALDDAIDILDILITDIDGEARKLGQKKRLRSLKDLDKSALTLAAICAMILNEETNDRDLRDVIYASFPREKLVQSIDTVNAIARPSSDNFHTEMVEQYGKVRRFLPRLLKDIAIKAAPAGQITFRAFNYLADLENSRKLTLDDAPVDIITNPWKHLVFDKEGRVTKRGYTLCFLDKLQDSLRRRDIFVENSDRWGDPRSKLLQGSDWQANRIQVCRSLGHPIKPDEAVAFLTRQLDETYKQVAENFDDNDA